jgi:ribA/ribD-fused uncharacterized protein
VKEYIVHNEKEIKGFDGDYRFLSNFSMAGVYFDGLWYPSTENAYQSAKTFDERERKRFRNMTPGQSKKEGRKLEIRADWDKVKIDVMSSIVFDKFYRNKELRQKLMDTGDKYLEETNDWGDKFWGVCDGEGQNELGKILMNIRNFWKNGE